MCFVKLQLNDRRGQTVSDNFYWLPCRSALAKLSPQEDLAALKTLPLVRLDATLAARREGDETVARVTLRNPTDKVALLIHAAVTKGPYGEEVVPVLWSDNYLCLEPGESRQLTARFATGLLGGSAPALEVGGWNAASPFQCGLAAAVQSPGEAGRAGDGYGRDRQHVSRRQSRRFVRRWPAGRLAVCRCAGDGRHPPHGHVAAQADGAESPSARRGRAERHDRGAVKQKGCRLRAQ